MADSCATCKFYRDGNCVAHAPQAVPVEVTYARLYDAVWPRVKGDDWCGEWAAIPAPA